MSAPETALADTTPVGLAAAAQSYVLRRGRNASGETARGLAGVWVRFAAFLRSRGRDPTHPTADDVSAFIEEYSQRYFTAHPGIKRANPYTLNTYIAYLKDYFRYFRLPVVEEEWLPHQRTTPRTGALEPADVRVMLDYAEACDAEGGGHRGAELSVRYPVVYTLLHTGVRRGELLALRPIDLHEADNEVFVFQGKGGKDRTVIAAGGVFRVIAAHLARYPARSPESPIFAFGDDTVERIVRRAGALLTTKTHPHLLRKTYTTALRDLGVDERYVAPQLGHVLTTMTGRVYDHVTPAKAKAVLLPVLERLYAAD